LRETYDKDRPAGFAPDFVTPEQWERRAMFLRHQVLVSQGLWPLPPRTPLEPVIHGRIERDGYTIDKVYFASMPGHYVTGNLYQPTAPAADGQRRPAVITPYGHWPEGRFVWYSDEKVEELLQSGAERTAEAARSPLQARCAMLARMGCIVFHYDMVGYCDSRAIVHREGFTDTESILRLQSFMGLQTWNSIRAVDFMSDLPGVDPERIGVTGASGGATQGLLLAAVDPRITAAFLVVMISMNMQGGCVCENAALLRVGSNNVELAALIAPRPLGLAAAQDWTHDFEQRGLPELKSVYRVYDAEPRVEGRFFSFPHNYNLHSREMMYNFMNRHLGLGWTAPVQEQPFVPVPPAELSVFDEDHPVPADTGDASALRRWMTRVSDEQLAQRRQTPGQYTELVRTALQAMIVDQLPQEEELVLADGGPPTGRGRWSARVARRGSEDAMKCAAVFPDQWAGAVVLWAGDDDADAMRLLQQAGIAVVTTESAPEAPGPAAQSYAGFFLGYNRSALAERVHRMLTVIAMIRSWEGVARVGIIGRRGAGVAALLTLSLADGAVDAAAIDLAEFDFDDVQDDRHPMFLSGAVKYGGVRGFMRLCAQGRTLVCGVRRNGVSRSIEAPASVTIEEVSRSLESLVQWLVPHLDHRAQFRD
jgi:hypothetical protein